MTMKYGKELATVLFATALGCGGKLLDMPDTGYAPLDGSSAGDDSATGGDDGGGSSSSGVSSSSGSSSGTGSSSGGRSSSSSSSSSGSSGGTSTCGGTVCTSRQVCCVSTTSGTQACTPTASCTGLALACGDSTTCPAGNVCCFTATLGGGGGGGGGFGGASACKATCPTGGLSFQLCSTDSECAKGVTCQATMFGGKVCGGTGGAGGGAGGLGGGAGGLGGLLCAHPDTPIATPEGERPIASLRVGDVVLSLDHGQVRAVPILRVNRSPAPNHHVVSAILASGRVLHISEGHPTADGRLFRDLVPGDRLGDVPVVSLESIPYDADATYDILPASDTGTYFAAGALIGSTLHH
jgi:hypothetical protein